MFRQLPKAARALRLAAGRPHLFLEPQLQGARHFFDQLLPEASRRWFAGGSLSSEGRNGW